MVFIFQNTLEKAGVTFCNNKVTYVTFEKQAKQFFGSTKKKQAIGLNCFLSRIVV